MSDATVNRIYDLKISGYDDAIAQVNNLTAAFSKMDDAKRKLNAQLQEKTTSGDTDAINQLTQKIKELETEMTNLKAKRDSAAKETALLAKAEKDQADAYLKTQKAAESLAKTEQIRTSNAISQEKELDRQIALEEKQAQQLLKEKEAADSLEGSYNKLKAQRAALEGFTAKGDSGATFELGGSTLNYDQAIAKIKEIKSLQQQYLDQLKLEQDSQATIVRNLQEKITQIKIERLELEKVVSVSEVGGPVAISGQTINYSDAIAQINQLREAGDLLTAELSVQGVEAKSLSNNYYGLLAAQSEAINLYRHTNLDSPIFEDVKIQAQEAAQAVQGFNRSLAPDGTLVGEYKTGIINAFKNLGLGDELRKQSDDISVQLNKLKADAEALASEYKTSAASGVTSFEKVEAQLKANFEQQEKLKASLANLNTAFEATGGIGTQISASIGQGFERAGTQLKTLLAGYIGFQAIFSGFSGLIRENKELGDSVANLQIYFHGTQGEAQGLIQTLKTLNTATSLTGLADIATTVAQKGVAKDQIVGVTQAFDQLFTALSKSGQSGDVHEGVFEIAKLISIFHDDHEVTPQRVRELGNAFFTLQSTGPVSNEFLQDFAARVGAVRSITGASIPQILGFGAAFQQLGQREEVAGSATSILLTKLIGNVDKFAKIAGIVPDKLREIIKVNPFEGLLAVAEGIKKNNPAGGVEDLVKAIGELGVSNVRARGAFSELINNSELFRAKMEQAGGAINDTSGLLTAFGTKQETFSATIQKTVKEFELVGANQNFQDLVKGIAEGLLFVVKLLTAIPFGVVIAGITAMTAAWLFYKGNLTLTRLEQSANNEATLLGYIRLNLMKTGLFGAAAAEQAYALSVAKATTATTQKVAALTAEIAAERASILALEAKITADAEQAVVLDVEIASRRAHIVALEGEIVATEAATVATEGLNVATKANPLGILLTLLALIIPAFTAFGNKSEEVSIAIAHQNSALQDNVKFNNEIASSIQEQTGKTKNSISELISIIESETTNLDLRKKAYMALISISPDFIGTVDAEYRATDKLNQVYDQYIAQLDKVARAKAIQNVNQKIQDDLALKQGEEFQAKIEADQEAADNKKIEASNKNKLSVISPAVNAASSAAPGSVYIPQSSVGLQSESTVKSNALAKAKAAAEKSLNESKNFKTFMESASAEDKAALVAGIQAGFAPAAAADGGSVTVAELKAQLKDVNDQIAALDAQKNKTADVLSKLKELRAQRSAIQKEIKEMNTAAGVTKTGTSGRNPYSIEDDFNKKALAALQQYNADEIKLLQTKYKLEADDQNNSQDQRNAALTKYYATSKQIIANTATGQTDALNLDVAQGTRKADLLKDPQKRADALIAIEKYKVDKIKEINLNSTVALEALDKTLFDEREKTFTAEMNTQINNAKAVNKLVQDNPNASPGEKAASQVTEDNAVIRARVGFFLQMDGLQKTFNQNAKTNWEDFRRVLSQAMTNENNDALKAIQAQLLDIDKVASDQVDKIQLKYDKLKGQILGSNQTNGDKNAAVNILNQTETVETGGVTQSANVKKVVAAQQLYDFGLITTKQFKDIYDAAVKGQQDLNNAIEKAKNSITTVKGLVGSGLGNLFGFADGSGQATVLAETISAAFSTAGQAMNDYFDSEKNRIQSSLRLNEQRLNIQLGQAKNQAQSQAEMNSLDAQFAAKKLVDEQKAFEANKKLQIQQAKINLAIQLSNLAVIAFAPNPLNIATLGIAGTIMYSIQAALALANYALNVSRINSATFAAAKGGRVPGKTSNSSSTATTNNYGNRQYYNSITNKYETIEEDPLPNGKITKGQNIPTQHNGDNVLATVRTNEVILNEEQQRNAGGPAFFRALGVPGFAGGGVAINKKNVDNSRSRITSRTVDILSNFATGSDEKAISINRITFEETLKLLQLNRSLASSALEDKKMTSLDSSKVHVAEERKLQYATAALREFSKYSDNSILSSIKERIIKSAERITGTSNEKRLTAFNAEIIKMAVSSLVKNTVNETKTAYFENKISEITRQQGKEAVSINKSYVNRLDTARSRDEIALHVTNYLQDLKHNEKTHYEEKKSIATEKLSVDLQSDILSAKSKYPSIISYFPIKKIENKHANAVKNIGSTISNMEKREAVSSNAVSNNSSTTIQNFNGSNESIPQLKSGKIIAPANIKTQVNGDNILATVKTGEVILNESQQRKAGGNEFFHALGVPGYNTGGKVVDIRAFATGGYTGIGSDQIGSSLTAPVNPQSFLSGNSGNQSAADENNRQIKELTGLVYETSRQVHQRIDRFEVVLDPQKVEQANTRTRKATKIGSL